MDKYTNLLSYWLQNIFVIPLSYLTGIINHVFALLKNVENFAIKRLFVIASLATAFCVLMINSIMPSVRLDFLNAYYMENRQSLQLNSNAVWDEIKLLGNKVSLYPDSYDVERVRRTLRLSKLLSAKIMKKHTSLKWILVLEGNQTVLFKPALLDKKLENFTGGYCGCEHPEYEIVAFAINRLLGLRNMPFVTGRQLNWFTDILPVADKNLLSFERYPPGDDTYCRYFRSTADYYKDERFVNILDMAVIDYMMLSYDSKDDYIINNKSEFVNIMIDRGKSFFEDDPILLAPIYQCCKIRKKVYKSLLKLKDNFEEEFIKETQTDQLYPCLDNETMTAIKSRIDVILKFVKICENKFGLKRVLMDL